MARKGRAIGVVVEDEPRPKRASNGKKKRGENAKPKEASAGAAAASKGTKKRTKAEQARELQEKLAKQEKRLRGKLKRSPRSTIREVLPNVMVAMIREAEKGSCPHAKLVLDMADIESMPDAKEQKSGKELAERVLSKLG